MAVTLGKAGAWALAGTMVAGGPMMAACSSGPTYDQWAATDGAAGRINLDDVQQAFKSANSVTDFEQRVNQIYEGDGIVLVRAKQEPDGLLLEGWEDLDGNYEISDAQDDLLFTILERNKQHEMRGYGANSYYNSGFGAGNFLFTYMIISSLSPRGYYYSTPPNTSPLHPDHPAQLLQEQQQVPQPSIAQQQLLFHAEGVRRLALRQRRPQRQHVSAVLPGQAADERRLQEEQHRRQELLG